MYAQDNILCQFGPKICPQFNNSYLNQFSSISGGNCIKFAQISCLADRVNLFGVYLTKGGALRCGRKCLLEVVGRDEVVDGGLSGTSGEVLDPVHHGYKPLGALHAEVDAVCNGPFLKAVSHVADVLFFNVVKVVQAIETCLSADGQSLVRDPKTDPFEALVNYDVRVNHSCHVVDSVVYLWRSKRKDK